MGQNCCTGRDGQTMTATEAGEIAKKIEASQNLDRWLQSKDIDLFVATDASYVHKAVRRKKIQ